MNPTLDLAAQRATAPATYSLDEAAAIVGLPRSTTYDAIRRGDLPSIRIGRRLRVPAAQLWRLLDGEA